MGNRQSSFKTSNGIKSLLRRKKKLRLTDLPKEILLKILSYIPTEDLITNITLVSKYFYELSLDRDVKIQIGVPLKAYT